MEVLRGTNKREEIGCWNCVVEGIKTGKPVCPDCGTEIAHYCGMYSHEKVVVPESKMEREER